MIVSQYNTTQPRVCVLPPPQDDGSDFGRELELGQSSSQGEAAFFLSIGYIIRYYWWDGKRYA